MRSQVRWLGHSYQQTQPVSCSLFVLRWLVWNGTNMCQSFKTETKTLTARSEAVSIHNHERAHREDQHI